MELGATTSSASGPKENSLVIISLNTGAGLGLLKAIGSMRDLVPLYAVFMVQVSQVVQMSVGEGGEAAIQK